MKAGPREAAWPPGRGRPLRIEQHGKARGVVAHAAGHPKQKNRPPAQGTLWARIDPAVVLPGEGVCVLNVGLDLSREQVEVCLISDQGS